MFMNNAAALSMDSAFGFTERREEVIFFFSTSSYSYSSRERERERDVARSRERSVKLLELSLVFQTRSFDFFPALSRARRLDDTFYIPTKPTILLLVLLLLLLI
jgi:hypothetical protein